MPLNSGHLDSAYVFPYFEWSFHVWMKYGSKDDLFHNPHEDIKLDINSFADAFL